MRARAAILGLALLATAATAADRRLADAVLADVGGRLVTLSDVAVARALDLFGLEPSDGPITEREIDRYLDAQLAVSEAIQLGIGVSADEVDRAWEAAGGPALGARLAEAGVSPAWARRLVEADLRADRFVEVRFRAFAFVTDADLEQALGPGPHDEAQRERTRARLRDELAARALATWTQEAARRIGLRRLDTPPGPWPAPFSLAPPARGR
jgi:hypothetical protein